MIMEIILLVLLANLMFGIVLYTKVRSLYKYPNLLGFPVVGNLYYFYYHLFFFSKDCSERYFSNLSEKYGMDVFFTFMLGTPTLVLGSPKHIEEIAHHPSASEKAKCMYGTLRYVFYGPFASIGPENEWKIKRKEHNRALSRSLIEKIYHGTMTRQAKLLAEQMERGPKNFDIFYHVITNFIETSALNFYRYEVNSPITPGLINKLLIALHLGGTAMGNRIFGCLFRLFTKVVDIFQAVGQLAVQHQTELRKSLEEQTLSYVSGDSFLDPSEMPLGVAITMRRNKKQNSTFRDLIAELSELLITASHTSSMTVIGAITFLATHPEVQERVWKEQNEIFGGSARDPTVEDVKRMTYLERSFDDRVIPIKSTSYGNFLTSFFGTCTPKLKANIFCTLEPTKVCSECIINFLHIPVNDGHIKESLRFVAPASIMKEVTGEINLGGMIVPPGISILFLLDKMRKDPRYWTKPQVFDPDRFLDEDNIQKYAYAPFGIGIRSCPGKQYAFHQLKTTISTLIRRFKLSSNQKFEELEYDLTVITEITNLSPFQIEERN